MGDDDQDGLRRPRRRRFLLGRGHAGGQLNDQSLVTSLYRLFAVLVVLVLAFGVAGELGLMAISRRIDEVSELSSAEDDYREAMTLAVDARQGVYTFLLNRNTEHLRSLSLARGRVADLLVSADRRTREAGLQADGRASRLWLDWLAAADRLVIEGGMQPGPDSLRQYELGVQKALRTEMDRAWTTAHDERVRRRDNLTAMRSRVVWLVPALTLLAVVTSMAASRRGVRSVLEPLESLKAALEEWRAGHYDARAPQHGPLEVRQVARAANALADEIERLGRERDHELTMRTLAREVSERIRQELDAESVLSTAARLVGENLQADYVAISRHADHVQHSYWHRSGQPWRDPPSEPLLVCELSSGTVDFLRCLAREGEVLHLDDATAVRDLAGCGAALGPQQWLDLLDRHPLLRSVIVAPVEGADVVIGYLLVGSRTTRTFTHGEARATQLVASDLGRALELTEVFAQQLELVDRLQDLDRQKTDFLSTVSHELRTPLASIRGYVEMLADGDYGPVTEQMAATCAVIERNVVRLSVLIEDLLAVSRGESGHTRHKTAPVDLVATVRQAAEVVRPSAEEADVRVEVQCPEQVQVEGHAQDLERVVMNLLNNAVKFTPAGGSVRLSVDERGDEARIVCSDTGIGIPAADREHLFERFFRASNAVDAAVPGTGLGLSIVQRIVEHHGGSVAVTSETDVGTSFTVRLPRQPSGE